MVAGGHAWLPGGVCVVARGACMVVWGGGEGACMVYRGGMCGCGGDAWLPGGHAWLPEGVHGCQGVCVVAWGVHGCGGRHAWLPGGCVVVGGGGMCRIRRDTVNERAVRILLECILVLQIKFIQYVQIPDRNLILFQ